MQGPKQRQQLVPAYGSCALCQELGKSRDLCIAEHPVIDGVEPLACFLVQILIEQLEEGHSDALTAYLDAMSRFHNYSLDNIFEIARQHPDASRIAGFWKWKELGRFVKKGEKGIRILAPIIGVRRKKEDDAARDITKQNTAVLVGFHSAYVFEVSQTEGAELPELREISGDVGGNRELLLDFINHQGIELVFTERIAHALA